MNSTYFSQTTPIFNGIIVPHKGTIVGYTAIISKLKLPIPVHHPISLIAEKRIKEKTSEWNIFPNSYLPEDSSKTTEIKALYKHLVFALKYEGVNLLIFSHLTKYYNENQLTELVNIEPTGQYSRRIWFIIEWIMGKELKNKEPISKKNYIPVIDSELQFAIEGNKSPRHQVINNLPGTPNFCPLISKTEKLKKYISENYSEKNNILLKGIHKDLLQRTSAFLLLKDSKASFTIEGESPKSKRATRWGQVIGQAGLKSLSEEELKRLQQVVIENSRFVDMGFRKKGGFVGEHDRITGEPIPDHISAKWEDIDKLIDGLIKTYNLLIKSDIDAVLAATIIAFGFVFIHPFEDGNGRIHRYLIHHILAKKEFSKQGIIFPISASILDHIDNYRKVLESYSHPIQEYIDWKETKDHNIEVISSSIDFYRYYDATLQAEFLFDCVNDTIERIIPQEINYLSNYDEFKIFIDDEFEMPDKMVAQLVRFLEQNNGQLSKRAKKKEFDDLSDKEVETIELQFQEIFDLNHKK
jgi:Fic family protein